MKRYVKLLCAALSLVLMLSLLPVGAFAAVVRPGATDGAGGVANAIEDFLKGNLKDPSASEVIGKVTDVITCIDVENIENVIASKLANYDYSAASQLLGSGILKISFSRKSSICLKRYCSSGATSVIDIPFSPARAVRPMR